VSDINTVVVDSLKALDPERPIREADIVDAFCHFRFVLPEAAVSRCGNSSALLDHLVGAGEDRRRHRQAERLSPLQLQTGHS
jgi:hypothetical protein